MAKPERPKSYGGLRVLIAGGGVAGLETLLALRALAGDLVDLELLAPEPTYLVPGARGRRPTPGAPITSSLQGSPRRPRPASRSAGSPRSMPTPT